MWLNSLFKYPNLTLHIKCEILVFEEVKFAGTLQKKKQAVIWRIAMTKDLL